MRSILFVQLPIDWIGAAVKIWQHFDNSVFEYVYISEIWQAIRSRDEWWPRIVILLAFDCWSQNCQLWISFCIFQDFLAFSLINANGHLKKHRLIYGRAQWDFKNCLEELPHMFFNVKLNFKVGFFWNFFDLSTPWGRKMHICKCMGISMGKWPK